MNLGRSLSFQEAVFFFGYLVAFTLFRSHDFASSSRRIKIGGVMGVYYLDPD